MGKTSDIIHPPSGGAKDFLRKLFLAFLIVAAIGGLIYIIFEEIVEKPLTPNIIQIKDVFVDINGDGLVDYINSANVVINTGNNLNLPVSP